MTEKLLIDMIYATYTVIFFFTPEIQGSDGTPYNGGSFRLEIQVPERYM